MGQDKKVAAGVKRPPASTSKDTPLTESGEGFRCRCGATADSWQQVRAEGWLFVNQQALAKDDHGRSVWYLHQGQFCSRSCLREWCG